MTDETAWSPDTVDANYLVLCPDPDKSCRAN